MWPRFWGASTKRCKDAGRPASGASGATEDAATRRVIAFQEPGGHCLKGHYTGVFSLFYGTSRQFQGVWQPGMSTPAYLRAMADSVLSVLTMNDPPALDWHALPIVVGAAASLLALAGVPGLRALPFAPALFCLAGLAGSLVARASAYPGRFSIHLIGVTSAVSVCLAATLCRIPSTRSTSSSS